MSKPELLAEFELDKKGEPKCDDGHYSIRLFVKDAPKDTSSVKYTLDSSYYEPVRIVTKGPDEFEEYLTSYGDYDVKAVINRRSQNDRLSRPLTEALRARYGEGMPTEIKNAIKELAEN